MSSTDRQNRLLLAEDWKRVYQSFRNADFQSYDFDNLRRTMINYLRENYPEDFNDYVESSEYLALIDLIAFLGQNISFRIDLNARENYLELAERRESILRLARMLSYNPKRNIGANGLLKFDSVSTTEEIIDSNGFNLSGQPVVWNDPSNLDWYEQFVSILNAALPVNGTIGRPNKKDTVAGVPTQQYRFNSLNTDVPKYSFNKAVEGKSLGFEIVSTDVDDGNINEEIPLLGNSMGFLYRDDGKGPASSNSGFFALFKQGALSSGEFSVKNPTANQVIEVDARDINNSDVWLYKLDSQGRESQFWSKVDSVEGNNIIYNSLSKSIRNVYSVLTRTEDRIGLIFSDGVFGNLPQGNFRTYYRTSANRRVIIKPSDLFGINIKIPYLSRAGTSETLTITLGLKYTVDNGAPSESNNSIKQNAPATYYTQNRMITGEDYNISPLGVSQDIIKAKSVNRVASGISRYYDLLDATGKYSKTNLFATDGVLYREPLTLKTEFTFATQTDIEGAIENIIEPILKDKKVLNYYLTNFPKTLVGDLNATWEQTTTDTNMSTGYLVDGEGDRYPLGTFTANSLKLFEPGTLCKFAAPEGYYFTKDGKLAEQGSGNILGTSLYKWSKVVSVSGSGQDDGPNGLGAITFNDVIGESAANDSNAKPKLVQIIPKLANALISDVRSQIIANAFAYNVFGLRYDVASRSWRLITSTNLNLTDSFSLGKSGDISNQQLDASWLLLFQTDGEKYTLTYRSLRYVFESDEEIKFYYDSADKIYDNRSGKIVKDKIDVLSINPKNGGLTESFVNNFTWEIVEEYRDTEGYIDSKKIQVSFFDNDDDGVVDNPEIFEDVVNPVNVDDEYKYIFQEKYNTDENLEEFKYVSNNDLNVTFRDNTTQSVSFSFLNDGDLVYYKEQNIFKKYDSTIDNLVLTTDYKAFVGRDNLKFHYIHAADSNSRIDPSSTNIMDTYLLTKGYDISYRQWLNGSLIEKPLPPSSDALYRNYGQELDKIKSISDEIIYHPVKYKVLFGNKAESTVQATFKIVKNTDQVLNDNDIKARVIESINQYFALDNWDFGDTFYFSELSTFIMNRLSPDVVTVVIVPVQTTQSFGSLYEINAEADEIFISGATVDNIEIIDAITASRLRSSGNIVTSVASNNSGIQSSYD